MRDPSPTDLNPNWRGLILRSVVQALLRTVRPCSADPALDVFFEVKRETWDKTKDLLQSPTLSKALPNLYENLSLWPASCELQKSLASGGFNETTQEKYVNFMGAHDAIARTRQCNRRWAYACLALHIPDAPDPDQALKYLREEFSTSPPATKRLGSTPLLGEIGKKHLFGKISDMAEILRRQDRVDDAQWAENLSARLFTPAEERLFAQKARVGSPQGHSLVRKRYLNFDSDRRSSWVHKRDRALRSQRTAGGHVDDIDPRR